MNEKELKEIIDTVNFLSVYPTEGRDFKEYVKEQITDDNIIEKSIKEYNVLYESADEFYRKHFINEECKLLPEGIDIDEKYRKVAYNPNHEDYVVTSLQNNPTKNFGFGKGVNVWSIFKRNKTDQGDKYDGNPLVYAFKNEGGWCFKSNQDRKNILYQVNLIVGKFFKENGIFSPTVVIPSSSQFNTLLSNAIKKYAPNTKIINDVLTKMGVEEVYNDTTGFNTPFRKVYNTRKKFDIACKELRGYCNRMNRERRGLFTFHFIEDVAMRSVISRTLQLTNGAEGKYSEDINGKDILIIDDTISQGNTIKYACDSIRETFLPKSITVLTMFSKL
jgi:hypothetical protein